MPSDFVLRNLYPPNHHILFLPSEYRNTRNWYCNFIEPYQHTNSLLPRHNSRKMSRLFYWQSSSVFISPTSFFNPPDQRLISNEKGNINIYHHFELQEFHSVISDIKQTILSLSSSIHILHIKLSIPSHPLTLACVNLFEFVFFFSVSAETQTTLHPVAAVAHSRSVSHI